MYDSVFHRKFNTGLPLVTFSPSQPSKELKEIQKYTFIVYKDIMSVGELKLFLRSDIARRKGLSCSAALSVNLGKNDIFVKIS